MKPELFKHEGLFDLEKETGLPIRLAFIGLFTCCDREGRFKWRPRELKTYILPYDDVDFSKVLDAMAGFGLIVKYVHEGESFGTIPTWLKHQVINQREAQSLIPSQDTPQSQQCTCTHVHTPECTWGKERKGKERNKENGFAVPVEKHEITAQMAGRAICEEIGMNGSLLLQIAQGAVESYVRHTPGKEPTDAYSDIVALWREYDSSGLHVKCGIKAFLSEGKFLHPEKWRKAKSNGTSKAHETPSALPMIEEMKKKRERARQ